VLEEKHKACGQAQNAGIIWLLLVQVFSVFLCFCVSVDDVVVATTGGLTFLDGIVTSV
jgi:hypothetical protein